MNADHEFHVFLSYNGLDSTLVARIAGALKQRGLKVFLDRWELVPGRDWQSALETHLNQCRSAAIFLGPHELGSWQQREKAYVLDRQARDPAFGVIPVILPGGDPALGFLSLNTWVDLRGGVDDPEQIDLLASAVRGESPSALRERTRKAAAQVCPYRGLNVFREEDAPYFFGREAFIERLVEEVETQSLIAVVGRSGSGKSSVVRAGLVPQLRQPDGPAAWEVVTLVPGRQPLHAVASGLLPLLEPEMTEVRRLSEINDLVDLLGKGKIQLHQVIQRVLDKQQGTDRLLLVIDQWEELYTSKPDDESANTAYQRAVKRFIDELLAATENTTVTVVLTLRADFYSDALRHRHLADALADGLVNLGPMTREELERAIKLPAEKVGLTFDPGLTDRLLDDIGEEPGNLPLMEFALKALWETRHGNRLLHESYTAMGGVRAAIADRAEKVYARFGAEQQHVARKVFTCLVRPGEETGDTRRRAKLEEFDEAGQALVRILAGRDARLLVTGRDLVSGRETVEVAHEALLWEWPRLVEWIKKSRDALRMKTKVQEAKDEWIREGRSDARRWKHEVRAPAQSLLAEAGLLDDLERDPDIADFLIPEADWLLAELLCARTDHARREDIGLRLAEIGDPRPGVGVKGGVPDILWCDVTAGEVAIEGHGRFKVERFKMAAYPVTHAQFAAFIAAPDGFTRPDWWEGLKKAEAVAGRIRRHGNYPATHVSWFDATAFCRWLSKKLGYEVRLPDEWERQWAAQSAETGFAYPWGPEWQAGLANTSESGIARTTAVGMYPGGCSWQGVYDLAGNVWEWCRNTYENPRDTEPGGDAYRVVRGGSWLDLQDDARAVYRYNLLPTFRLVYVGFHVVC